MKILKTHIAFALLHIIAGSLLLSSCSKSVTYTDCDQCANKDSLVQRIVEHYDVDAFNILWRCYEDSAMDLYAFLIADSSGTSGFYGPTYLPDGSSYYGLNDTVTLFYEMKGVVMGCYTYFDGNRQRRINFPDSIYDSLCTAFHRYGVTVQDKDRYANEYKNIDSLCTVVLTDTDIISYNKLRLLVSQDSLLPISIHMANNTHNPVACYDVYYNSVRGFRLTEEEFRFAYSYLCESADSLYYPALFLKAGLYLTGAYFPQDTVLGKSLLDQCHARSSVPFWQQYSMPVVYGSLLRKYKE